MAAHFGVTLVQDSFSVIVERWCLLEGVSGVVPIYFLRAESLTTKTPAARYRADAIPLSGFQIALLTAF